MTETITLKAEKREENKNPRQLRKDGLLPATVYGKGMESVSVQLDAKEFGMFYKKSPEATLKLAVDKKTYDVQVADVQMNYSLAQQLNVEFKLV